MDLGALLDSKLKVRYCDEEDGEGAARRKLKRKATYKEQVRTGVRYMKASVHITTRPESTKHIWVELLRMVFLKLANTTPCRTTRL
jgi:hypothetical protein